MCALMLQQFNRAEVLLADMGDANMPDDLFLEYSEPRSVSISLCMHLLCMQLQHSIT
jgi:hypothetical protein